MDITITIKYASINARLSISKDATILQMKERISQLPELLASNNLDSSFEKQASSSKTDVELKSASSLESSSEFGADSKDGGISPLQQRLIYKGRVLRDELTVGHYDMLDGHFIHLVKSLKDDWKLKKGERLMSDITGTSSEGLSSEVRDLLSQIETSSDLRRLHSQILRNPALTQQIMGAPMMDALLNNPAAILNNMLNSPEIKALIAANPDIATTLKDPAAVRRKIAELRSCTPSTSPDASSYDSYPASSSVKSEPSISEEAHSLQQPQEQQL